MLCALACLPGTAAAGAKNGMPSLLQPEDVWAIRAVPTGDDSSGGYCLLDQPYENGFRLHFALLDEGPKDAAATDDTPEAGHLSLGLVVPRAGFGSGDTHDLILQIDSALQRPVRAVAKTGDLLVADIGRDRDFIYALRHGMQLIAIGRIDHTSYALPNLDDAFTHLAACAADLRAKAQDRARAAHMLVPEAWPESLGALLRAAGLTGAVPVALGDVPPDLRPADYVWRHGNVLGGVRETQAPDGASLEGMVKFYADAFREKCQGKFTAREGTALGAGMAHMMPGTIACELTDTSIFAALIYVLSRDGVFTLYLNQGEAAAAAQATADRDAIMRTLRGFYADAAKPGTPVAAKKP